FWVALLVPALTRNTTEEPRRPTLFRPEHGAVSFDHLGGSCARADSVPANAAPPRRVMNFRRLIRSLIRDEEAKISDLPYIARSICCIAMTTIGRRQLRVISRHAAHNTRTTKVTL